MAHRRYPLTGTGDATNRRTATTLEQARAIQQAETVRSMTYEDLRETYRPLIMRYARKRVRGTDPQDVAQTVEMVLWRCATMYDPGAKEAGPHGVSSFLNYTMTAMNNALSNLAEAARRQEPAVALRCEGCEAEVALQTLKCMACGGRRLRPIHSEWPVVSVEGLLDADAHDDLASVRAAALDEPETAYDFRRGMQELLELLTPQARALAVHAAGGGVLTEAQREYMRSLLLEVL